MLGNPWQRIVAFLGTLAGVGILLLGTQNPIGIGGTVLGFLMLVGGGGYLLATWRGNPPVR